MCLESSKTAWEGFTFTSLVNEVDPQWARTIVVVTKFNYLLSSGILCPFNPFSSSPFVFVFVLLCFVMFCYVLFYFFFDKQTYIMDSEDAARQYLSPYFQGKGQKTGQTIIHTKVRPFLFFCLFLCWTASLPSLPM